MTSPQTGEVEAIRDRYLKRAVEKRDLRYSLLERYNLLTAQERERAIARAIVQSGMCPIANKTVLEVGCGSGDILLFLLRLGFQPQNLAGSEILEERVTTARARLPSRTRIIAGNALDLDLPPCSFDLVLQFTVFTSILDQQFQAQLAAKMWSLIKPHGGGVLWYDFIYNNPSNPDVKGVPVTRIRELFPAGHITVTRVTLAPPIGRRVVQLCPSLYGLFNLAPFLRTHVLCWIQKP